jgi:periplasmic copper chaperone A
MTFAKPAVLAAALLAPLASAQELPVLAHRNGILIEDGYARATGANAPTGAAYMRITNETGADDRLVEVQTDAAARAELHVHEMQDGITRMRRVEGGITVPAHGTVTLKGGGSHVMLMGLAAPLQQGAGIALALIFERAGTIPVTVPVDLGRTPGAEHHMHGAGD